MFLLLLVNYLITGIAERSMNNSSSFGRTIIQGGRFTESLNIFKTVEGGIFNCPISIDDCFKIRLPSSRNNRIKMHNDWQCKGKHRHFRKQNHIIFDFHRYWKRFTFYRFSDIRICNAFKIFFRRPHC